MAPRNRKQRKPSPAFRPVHWCRWCGGARGHGLELCEHEARAVTLCRECRGRLAKALDGDSAWVWMARTLSINLREHGVG